MCTSARELQLSYLSSVFRLLSRQGLSPVSHTGSLGTLPLVFSFHPILLFHLFSLTLTSPSHHPDALSGHFFTLYFLLYSWLDLNRPYWPIQILPSSLSVLSLPFLVVSFYTVHSVLLASASALGLQIALATSQLAILAHSDLACPFRLCCESS